MSESQSPVPVSLSGVSGISACHFRTFQSLAELWIFGVGSATFSTTDGLFDSKPVKLELPPRCSHAHSFEFFLGILPLNPRFFFHHLVPHVCPSIWHIENSRASLWNQRKRKVICLSISQALFLLLYHFHMNMNIYETHDLTNYQLTVGSFLPEITFLWSDQRIPGWPQFFQQQLFPYLLSIVDFNCTIYFWSFHLDFMCANLDAPITVCFWIFASIMIPYYEKILPYYEIVILRRPLFVSIVQ